MSESLAALRRQIKSAEDLRSVVRTMKALAASNIGQYERSVQALADYDRTVELGLSVCFRQSKLAASAPSKSTTRPVGAIVFGSDQGLVGQFNDLIADFVMNTLASLPGEAKVWAVGERVRARLADSGLTMVGVYPVPNSVNAITPLIAQIQIETETHRLGDDLSGIYVFHNRPQSGALYDPVAQRLLPLDDKWRDGLIDVKWPTTNLPEVVGAGTSLDATLRALVREYLFISLFRACAESLASENASRLAAMERAEKSIDDLRESLHGKFHRLRQSAIDEELFDVVAGFEALVGAG